MEKFKLYENDNIGVTIEIDNNKSSRNQANMLYKDATNRFSTNNISLLTPYPIYNHVNCEFLHYDTIKMVADEDTNSIKDQYSNSLNDSRAYKNLLDKSGKNQSVVDADVQELRLVDDWLMVLVEQHPNFPVKKFFQHFLSCQKSVITKNIERNEASTKNVKSIWERDAEVQLINNLQDDQRNKEIVEKNVVKKCTDVKDIRLLLKKTVKKRVKNCEEKSPAKCEATDELLDDSIVNVEDFDETEISHKKESINVLQKIEQMTSPTKVDKISINGLMKRALQKRDQRKARRDRAKEFFNYDKQLNKKISVCNKKVDDNNIKDEVANSILLVEDFDSLPGKIPNSVNKPTEDVELVKKSKSGKKKNSKDIRAMFLKEEEVKEDSLIKIKSLSSFSVVKTSSDENVLTNLLNIVNDELPLKISTVEVAADLVTASVTETLNIETDKVSCVKNEIKSSLFPTSFVKQFDISLPETGINFDGDIKCIEKNMEILDQYESLPAKFDKAEDSIDCFKQLIQPVSKIDEIKKEISDVEGPKQVLDNIINGHKHDGTKNCIKTKTIFTNKKASKSETLKRNKEMTNDIVRIINNEQPKLCEHSVDRSENKVCDSCKCLNLIDLERNKPEECEQMNVRRSSRHKRKVDYFEDKISPQKTDIRAKKFPKCSSEPVLMSSMSQEFRIIEKKLDNYDDMDIDKSKLDLDEKKLTQLKSSQFKDISTKVKPSVELNEVVVNSFLSWTEKYQPTKPRFVLGNRAKVRELFDWLNSWKERNDIAAQRTSRRNNSESESDLSIFSDDDENSFINTLLLTGPIGCGTTAAVVACAKQMQFKILEINPSILRTGKHVMDRVAEAVVSHQIPKKHLAISKASFFSCKSDKQEQLVATTQVAADEISLVLFEHVDIVYEDHDKGFWQGLNSLCRLSKRPIILTANDPSTIIYDDRGEPVRMESISLERPSTEQLLPMMQIICLIEHVFIPSEILLEIIKFCNNDVRKTLLQLQFWFEQGKEPMYKLWKERCLNKTVTNNSPSQLYSNDKSQTDNTLIKESSLVENCEPSDQSKKKTFKIMIPRFNLKNFWKNPVEEFFNIESISSLNLWNNQCIDSHHTFIKKKSKHTTGDHFLHNLGNIVDCVSDMDCYLRPRYDCKEKDVYQWSAFLKDSLVDSLTSESGVPNPYPISEMLESAKFVVENCYEQCYEKKEKLEFIQHRTNHEDLVFQRLIESKMPTLSRLDRQNFYQDVLPCLRSISSSEEQKRILQDKRRSRRFLHYLDSVSLGLDENVLKKLSASPFSIF
ncbi:uncharacterized protein LOC100207471 isoform X1 [Hydra vulgaris]|uniref:uncharacterized protein LOC100207471 isoform X1 n=1 Tax=Hydra vulgaris TaxID=6087 RepID=UPI001F5FA6E9|nr:uncharacterized protein LOC100207471 [Hydra vulgaris]